MYEGNPQGGPAIIEIEIEIAIEIGKLPGVDFDHDFDFDSDSELPRFENKLALPLTLLRIDYHQPSTSLRFQPSQAILIYVKKKTIGECLEMRLALGRRFGMAFQDEPK
jgi:hypothetical protein